MFAEIFNAIYVNKIKTDAECLQKCFVKDFVYWYIKQHNASNYKCNYLICRFSGPFSICFAYRLKKNQLCGQYIVNVFQFFYV